jgi:hypothetical protein
MVPRILEIVVQASHRHEEISASAEYQWKWVSLSLSSPNRLCDGLRPPDQDVVGSGRRTDGLLQETEEELAAALGLAAIAPKREFIQVVREGLMCHGALVGAQPPALQ